ncbi:2-hydroxyacid dehydrogenase [Aestuariibacter halophilus]|uniref:2-hydroxyacid dehydrogenase n=1 Tax=Fluctibacter halophilus TaxID=226011 RepID=A0ABS8G4V2_9ALTE|nr:2-hydroxyacid dehydrogenase [Aestuariibacter halophilus]
MRVDFFSCKPYDRRYFETANHGNEVALHFHEFRLTPDTLHTLEAPDTLCVFVNDVVNSDVIDYLVARGTKHIALRCAGFNNVDINHARACHLPVSRVPAYSPQAVAEHTFALIMTLNRRLHKAYNRVRENNFSLEGLLGFNLHGKTLGVIGTGKIGRSVVNIARGFGCDVLCYDPNPDPSLATKGVMYTSLEQLLQRSDIVSLHCPLTRDTYHMINEHTLASMKPGVMLINTSRGGLVDTQAVIGALKRGHVGYLGLDVYEMESELFFEDKSLNIIQDDVFERLSTFPNVLITGHQGFFTHEALQQIADVTLSNIIAAGQQRFDPTYFLSPGAEQ